MGLVVGVHVTIVSGTSQGHFVPEMGCLEELVRRLVGGVLQQDLRVTCPR